MSLCLCLFLSFVLVCHRFLVCVFMFSSLCYHVIMSTSLHVSCFILFLCSVFSFILLLRCSCFLSIQTLHSFSHTPVQNRIHVTVFVVTVSSDLSLNSFFYLGLCTHVVTLYKRLTFCLSKLFVVYHSRNTQSAPAAFCCPMFPSTFFLLANDWISMPPYEMGLNHIGYT